jgi:hypothetical protein
MIYTNVWVVIGLHAELGRIAMAKRESKILNCAACTKEFNAFQDHGNWPKYCSRACFLSVCIRPKNKECKKCGKTFLARKCKGIEKSEDGLVDHCSIACRKTGELHTCINCKSEFYLEKSTAKQRGLQSCCSWNCRNEYYKDDKNLNFRLGISVLTETTEAFLLHRRSGYVGNYYGVHRIQAEKAIGRPLRTDEPVIRIDRDAKNNSPKNLFICASVGECVNRIHGRLPWPTESNLAYYHA